MRDYEHEIAKLAKKNPKAFYRYVNTRLKTRVGVKNLKSEDGTTIHDDTDRADAFNGFLSSVFTREDMRNIPTVDGKNSEHPLCEIDINEAAVYNVLKNLQQINLRSRQYSSSSLEGVCS